MKKKRMVSLFLALGMTASLFSGMAASAQEPAEEVKNDNLLRIWYDEPATNWETEALAIGNGYMGGLVFGGISKDRVHINEKTVWNGGPTASNGYNYGNTNPIETPEDIQKIKDDLQHIREQLDDKSEFVFGYSGTSAIGDLNKLMGDLRGYAAPQDYADIHLDFTKSGLTDDAVTNYVRDLDMRTALATVSYDYDGVHYTREYFNSYPDNVLVIRLEADQDGKLTFDTNMTLKFTADSNTVDGDTITIRGDISNGLMTEAQLKVLNEGGELTSSDSTISVTGANAATLILSCGTDYEMKLPDFRGEDPHEAVTQRLAAAAEKGYQDLKDDHVADHSALFSRLELGFNEEIPQIPTDELILKYRNMIDGDGSNIPTEAEQRALEVICYQFGRYLTIAGSREGALPTNLQGVWGEGGFDWYGDYHFNINVQMNYWPTLASNLAECQLPFNELCEALRETGRIAAAAAYGIKSEEGEENGWLVGCFSTPYLYAAMAQKGNLAGWNPIGSAWALLNVYEYYLYTGDVEYLRDYIYPSMKEVANFWNEALWWSEYQQRYVSGPSYSPENGPIVNGASYDQQFIWQHLENTIQATKTLIDAGYLDAEDPEIQENLKNWEEKQSKLDPVIIGKDGQVKEWFEETTFGKAQAGDLEEIDIPAWRDSLGAGSVPHRHISHLMALYPCNIISKDNPEFMDAAMVTLNERGLDATGWSKAHKLNLWARTGHAEETFQIVQSAVGGGNSGFLTNLFSSHGGGANYKAYPIFQIDGNFGYTAGVNEMLLQSQLGYTQFLPTIPEQWNTGFINGIVARGNFEIDMKWTDGAADFFKVHSNNGGEFIGEYTGLAGFTVTDSKGAPVEIQKLSDDKISFETVQGETYTLTPAGETSSFTVTFNTNGGSDIAPATVQAGEKLAMPEVPAKDGFVFAGWYTDAELTNAYDFEAPVTSSFTLYAKWIDKGEADSYAAVGVVDTNTKIGEKGVFHIDLNEAKGVALVEVTLTASDSNVTIQGLNGFKYLDTSTVAQNNGTVEKVATFVYLPGDKGGVNFNCDEPTAIAAITIAGRSSELNVSKVVVAGYAEDGTERYGTVTALEPSGAVYYLYDVSNDDTVNHLDVLKAQKYYQVSSANADAWKEASRCDVNDDSVVNLQDLIEILMNYSKID